MDAGRGSCSTVGNALAGMAVNNVDDRREGGEDVAMGESPCLRVSITYQ